MLKQNFDLIAVAIIVLVLGVMQAPKIGVQVARVAMAQKVMKIRNVRFDVPVPPCPPRALKPVLFQ